MRYKFLLSLLLCSIIVLITGITYRSFSQTGLLMSVYGWVRDVETGKPIPNITIHLFKVMPNGNFTYVSSGTSDSNGFYKVKYLEAGAYEFSIKIPEIGSLFIGVHGDWIEDTSSREKRLKGPYTFEVRKGENKNLNIFLGERTIPGVKREESLDSRRIDITMFSSKREELKADLETKTLKAIEKLITSQEEIREEYRGLIIIQHLIPMEAGDNEKLGKTGNADAEYQHELVYSAPWICEKTTCKFKEAPKGVFKGWIRIHNFDWIKKRENEKRKNKGEPPYSDDYIRCLINCLIVHEKTHMELATQIVKKCWDEYLSILPVEDKCCDECAGIVSWLENQLKHCVDTGIDATEDKANEEREKCKNSKCKGL